MTKEEVEDMTKQAELHTDEDTKKKELAEAKNAADTLIFTSEKSLKDAGDKVQEADRQDIEEKIKALREATGKEDNKDIEEKTKELSDALSKIGEQLYKEEGAAGSDQTAQQTSEDSSEEKKSEGSENSEKDKKKDEPQEGEVVN